MFQKKYLIMIGIIICLLVLYYFYDEISNIKKLFVPAYQKTMSLEAKLIQLEKKTLEMIPQIKKKSEGKIESPPLSITYNSDRVKNNGNLSLKYSAISDDEASELMKKLDLRKSRTLFSTFSEPRGSSVPELLEDHNKQQQHKILQNAKIMEHNQRAEKSPNTQVNIIPEGDFSDFKSEKNIFTNDNNSAFNETDTINFKITELIKPGKDKKHMDNETVEYEKILNGLETTNKENMTGNIFDDDIDSDIIKSITDSIKFADMPSENTLSEIPSTPHVSEKKETNKKLNKQKRKKQN